MDTRFDLENMDFETAYRVAHQRGSELRAAETRAFFTWVANGVRGLFSIPVISRRTHNA